MNTQSIAMDMANNAGAMLRNFWRQAVRMGRLTIGVPDYDTYVRHLRSHHPEREIPTYEQFFTERQDARYRNGGNRGCC